MTHPPPPSPRPVVIGLLGGIAAGKTTVAAMLAERGFAVLDADAEARAVTADPAIVQEIAARLGQELVRDGELDRKALAARVFADAQARAALEAIVHPAIRARLTRKLEAALAAGRSVVLDAPLLLEGGLIARCDTCVFVDADAATRGARARERGWASGELLRRERAQSDLAVKRARCQHTISTNGSLADVRRQVDELVQRLGG